MNREYKLAGSLIRHDGREIFEFADGHRKVIAVVPDGCAMDVRDALARAYQDGRDDLHAEDIEAADDSGDYIQHM